MLFGNVSKTQKALKSGGASDSMIDDLINASLRNLREQGVQHLQEYLGIQNKY